MRYYILPGLTVTYSTGQVMNHGRADSDRDVYKFSLQENERIIKVECRSGAMLDSLKFLTSLGRSFGPFGGDGGGLHVLEAPSNHGYLSYVAGTVGRARWVNTCITNLKFVWAASSMHTGMKSPRKISNYGYTLASSE
jgi:hypothetical protein